MKKLTLFLVILVLSACAAVRPIETGQRKVGERLTIDIQGRWNHLDFPGLQPAQLWTMEGVTVDQLQLYTDIKNGQAMHPDGGIGQKQRFTFRSNMTTEEIVSMFEGMMTRDGSTFKLTRLEPYPFGGRKGFHFEFERIRKIDGVRQQGLGFGATDKGELFALVYVAPRLTFFPSHKARIESIARSAVIR